MEDLFFEDWNSIFRTFIITIIAYISLITMLRASGKRTLSKMNAFDFVITVALGSTLANVSLNKDVALLDGVLALFILISLQFIITWLSVRVSFIKGLVTSTPSLILYKGRPLEKAMKHERVTIEEIRSKARDQGFASLANIDAIILETTGSITIIPTIDSQIDNVKNLNFYPPK
ncbi:DUF421 domain-containing protein [Litoribacter populi]|uniref:DUF421 domain-containing protein n=1 Tax=Litoribacter populi TaxID=2598460 RepID=UPI00117ED6C1|nr:YetF domain-containing protein [Litoribacter populi]